MRAEGSAVDGIRRALRRPHSAQLATRGARKAYLPSNLATTRSASASADSATVSSTSSAASGTS